MRLEKIQIYAPKLNSNSQKAFTLENNKKLGEKKNNLIFYSVYEAFYLIEEKKAELISKKIFSFEEAEKYFSRKEKNFYKKYLVFKNLRKKGYIVKTGLKFGGEFRVYEKNKKHALWITYIIDKKININEFISKNRIAHSTAKKMLLILVDEDSLLFYEVNWKKI